MWEHPILGDHEATGVSVTESPQAMVLEAEQLQRQHRVPEAIAAYQTLLARFPRLPDSWFNLGFLLRRAGQFDAALAAYQQALDAGLAGPEEAHVNRAVIYRDGLRDDAAAERELAAALGLAPNFLPALLNLANLREDHGLRREAGVLYERILALDPRCFEALARLANLQPPEACDARLVGRLEAALVPPAVSAAERASLGFALGRVRDALGAYDLAFEAYAAANRASRASAEPGVVSYDRRRQAQFVDRLIAAGEGVPVVSRGLEPTRPRPIFVCGSTLIEQLLAGHPGVEAGGELDFLPAVVAGELAPFPESLASMSPAQLATLAGRYRQMLARLFPGAEWVTDKRPDNFLYVGLIKALFPEARIVHTVREPLDNCLSVLFLHLDHRMSYALELMDIGHYYREYLRLMTHWKRLYGADIVDVSYDQLVREPDSTARELFAALGLSWDPAWLESRGRDASIKTASVWQVREPLYRHASGRAAHYERHLQALRAYLAEPARR